MDGLIIAGVVVIAMAGVFAYTNKYTKDMTHIGTFAVENYIVYQDEGARFAAMAVKAMLSKFHGDKWLHRLENWPFRADSTEAIARRAEILANLQYQPSSTVNCLEFKEVLAELSPEWKKAIDKCDLEAAAMIEILNMQTSSKTQEEVK